MTTTTNELNHIDDIVKVLNGGVVFYRDAIKKVRSPHAKAVFTDMIKFRRDALYKLQPLVVEQTGDIESSLSLAVSIRKKYTEIIGKITGDDHTYIAQLEEVEDKTLDVIREALKENDDPSVKQTLTALLAQAKVVHDQMKTLQDVTA